MQPIRMGMIGGEGAFIGAVHRHAAGLDGTTSWCVAHLAATKKIAARTAS